MCVIYSKNSTTSSHQWRPRLSFHTHSTSSLFHFKLQENSFLYIHPKPKPTTLIISGKLRVAVVSDGQAGSSAAETLVGGGVEAYLLERSPSTAKPCGGEIPLCMLDEFSIPSHPVDRRVDEDISVQ